MKNPFIKMLEKEDRSSIFHSSAHARMQSEGHFGAASSETFAQRTKIEQNRQYIQQYGSSSITAGGNQYNRAQTYNPTATQRSSQGIAARPLANGPRPAAPARPAISRPPLPKNPGIQR